MSAAHLNCGAAPALLAELHHADHIIKVMLNAMTCTQKAKVHEQLTAAGVSGDGMTRANERLAVIDAAGADSPSPSGSVRPWSDSADDIRHRAHDINAQAGDIEILLNAIFGKLDGMADLAPTASEAVSVINCFATCALRNAVLIKEANADILVLASEGGAV
jgi:hypothetical protein